MSLAVSIHIERCEESILNLADPQLLLITGSMSIHKRDMKTKTLLGLQSSSGAGDGDQNTGFRLKKSKPLKKKKNSNLFFNPNLTSNNITQPTAL